MKMLKRICASVLILGLMAGIMPARALQWSPREVLWEHNAALGDASEVQTDIPKTADEAPYCATFMEAAEFIRRSMVAREYRIIFRYPPTEDWEFRDLVEAACYHTGDPDEGDYLMLMHRTYSGMKSDGNAVLFMTYLSQAHHEAELAEWVDSWLAERPELETASDYEKLLSMYSWVEEEVVYDYGVYDQERENLKYTAWAAAVEGKCVCQGYALLCYWWLLRMGVENRIITGAGPNGTHAWNIVKLNGLYHNIDATWDAEHLIDSYFLKADEYFPHHTIDAPYLTAEFLAAHPKATLNYDPVDPEQPNYEARPTVTGQCGDSLTWELNHEGTLTISGTGDMWDFNAARPGWDKYRDRISQLVVTDGVESLGRNAFEAHEKLEAVVLPAGLRQIGDHAFYRCSALTHVEVPASVEKVGEMAFAGCESLETVRFRGNAPEFGQGCFENTEARLLYSYFAEGWNNVIREDFGQSYWAVDDNMVRLEVATPPSAPWCTPGEIPSLKGLELAVLLDDGTWATLDGAHTTLISWNTDAVGTGEAVVGFADLTLTLPVYVHREYITVAVPREQYPESSHEYESGTEDTQMISHPGAVSLTLVFSGNTALEHGYDWLYVYDGNMQQLAAYTGTDAAGVQLTVPGDTCYIRLESDEDTGDFGYSFDSITARTVRHEGQLEGAVEGSCTQDGMTGSGICGICGCQVDNQIIAAQGHGWVVDVPGTAPTCTQDGISDGRKCRYCGLVEPGQVLPALGHTGTGELCDRCGEPRHNPGDVNDDGSVTVQDAILVLRYVAKLIESIDVLSADVDGSGSVNIQDAILILRYVAKLITAFSAQPQ